MHSKRSDNKISETFISALDFERYLETLPTLQARELKDFMENHPLVESSNKGPEKYYRGSAEVLREIEYLISLNNQRNIQTSYEDYASSVEPSLFGQRTPNLTFNEDNFVQIISKIATLKRIQRCPLEMAVRGNQDLSSSKQIYITTARCKGVKKIYFIFQHFHQLVQLQAQLDMEWQLDTISKIREAFQEKGINMLRNSHNSYQLFFFQRTGREVWQKFIPNINKQDSESYIILMKPSLFPQLYDNRKLFTIRIRLAFDTIVPMPDFTVTQLKTFPSEVQFTAVHDRALAVLQSNEREYMMEDQQLDCITGFYCMLMEERKEKQMLVVRPDQANKKEFIYFTFYGKLMEVVREGHIVLVERSIKEEFPNSVYRNSLEDVLKEAAANECPFFYFCQQPREVLKVPISQLKKKRCEDANRLIYYSYLLNEKYYKVSAVNLKDIDEIVQQFQSNFLFKFDCEAIVAKMGKTKSDQIIKKYREGTKGCILAHPSFCRTFIHRWLQVCPLK